MFNYHTHEDTTPRSPFKAPMFRVMSVIVGLIFVLTIVMFVLMFTGNLPFSYHYEVTQTFGDVTYHEEYSTGK